MSTNNECIFCKIIAGQIPARLAYEDADCIAFFDINPQAPVHVLVVPREHIDSLKETTSEHTQLLGSLLRACARVADELGIAESGFRSVINTGPRAGQSVFHIHVHVLGGRDLTWPAG